jgi:SAM-dependent methyltransferase
MTRTTPGIHPESSGYAFDNSTPYAGEQLATLAAYLDPVTTSVLARLDLPDAARCLEIGAGNGSIAGWLADRVAGAGGQVIALDLDTTHLTPHPGVEVRRRDIRRGLPGGPFHLIHARLVLLHLPERRRLLRQLAATLAPGGWLVIGEFSHRPLRVIAAPSGGDAAVFTRVVSALTGVLTRHGADLDWANQLHQVMRRTGLVDVHTIEHAETWTGGSPGARLHHLNSLQKQSELLAAGISDADLARFRQLAADPGFCARAWQYVCTRGRRPAGRPTTT